MEIWPRRLKYYVAPNGRIPFREWYLNLEDLETKIAIRARMTRVERGLLGDCKPVGQGVYELRVFLGPGYRMYFGQQDRSSVILLCGGDKSNQTRDIQAAQSYWADYLRRS